MKLEIQDYVPCLRWKRGEYLAVRRLSPSAKANIVPIIEVPEIGYDFETQEFKKTLNDHIMPFTKRVQSNWGENKCFIDIHHLRELGLLPNGRHPFDLIFDDLRRKGVLAIPVVDLGINIEFQDVLRKEIGMDKRGLGLRVKLFELTRSNFPETVNNFLKKFDLSINECDVIIDLQSPNYEPMDDFVNLLSQIIAKVPEINRWRSIVVISTSFPASLGGIDVGLSTISRYEWRLYKKLANHLLKLGIRVPNFGDYTINNPSLLQLDMRLVKPSASIRYSKTDEWLISKGLNVRDNGFSQYRGMCRNLIDSGFFYGENFSAGDRYILLCANGYEKTGNLTTWRMVGTNHHIELAVQEISSFFGS